MLKKKIQKKSSGKHQISTSDQKKGILFQENKIMKPSSRKKALNASLSKKWECKSPSLKKSYRESHSKRSDYRTPKKEFHKSDKESNLLHSSSQKKISEKKIKHQSKDKDFLHETIMKMQKLKEANKQRIQTQNCSEIKKEEILENRDTLSPYIKCTKSVFHESIEETTEKKDKIGLKNSSPILKKSIIEKYWSPEKTEKISQQIVDSFQGQYQCLETNSLFSVNYRLIKGKIIEIEVILYKKADSLIVSLRKGSLQCQSIHQKYQNLFKKSSIVVMSAVYSCSSLENFVYPEVHVHINENNGSFGFQKRVILPYTWLNLISVLNPEDTNKSEMSRIKNKSIIEDIPFKKQFVGVFLNIFHSKYMKKVKKSQTTYLFCFTYMKEGPYSVKFIVNTKNDRCALECQSDGERNPSEILRAFSLIFKF